jgi:hypothetical protein
VGSVYLRIDKPSKTIVDAMHQWAVPLRPRHSQLTCALSSRSRPRGLLKRVSTPSFVFRSTESFSSSDEHNHRQIDQIHINGSKIGPRNSSATSHVLLSSPLFCHSSHSNDDVLRKVFRGTPLSCIRRYHRIPSRARVYLCACVPDLARACATMFNWCR